MPKIPGLLRGVLERVRRRRDPDAEIDEEFTTHLTLEADRQVANGLPPEEAGDAARKRFGNLLRYREETRAVRGLVWWDHLRHDIRSALRAIGRRPVASGAAMFALAIGMGAPSAVLAVMLSISTAVFPGVRDPDRLVMLWETPPRDPGRRRDVTRETLDVWRANASLVQQLSAVQSPLLLSLATGDVPENVTVQAIGIDLLLLLGVRPAAGRAFTDRDDDTGAAPVAVVTDGFLRARLGGRTDIVGSTLDLDGQRVTVVGVMPRGFWFGNRDVDLWVPIPEREENPLAQYRVVARLHDGDSKAALASRLAALAPQVAAAQPAREAGWGMRLDGLGPRELIDGAIAPGILLLITAATLGLIAACANIAMVMVARGVARQRETAVRAALGAPRARLIRQFLTESVLISLGGGALAILIAYAGLRLIVVSAPADLASAIDVSLDTRLMLGVTGFSIAIGLVSGLAPALADSRVDLVRALKDSGYFGSVPGHSRFRRMLIVGEVTITVILLATVSLLVNGAIDLASRGPGFDAEHVLRIRLDPVQHIGRAPSPLLDADTLIERFRAVDGVEAAAITQNPVPGWGRHQPVTIATAAEGVAREPLRVAVNAVGESYFSAMGLRLVDGRAFERADRTGAPVAVVASVFARQHFPSASVVGRSIRIGDEPVERTIVGVASDVLVEGMRREPSPIVYLPYSASSRPDGERAILTLLVRHRPGAEVVPDLRRAVTALNPQQTLAAASSIKSILDVGAQEVRVSIYLAGPVLVLALLLTMSGIYGLLSQSVTERTHEVAVRMAVGASRTAVIALIVGQGLKLAGTGAITGAIGALMLDRLLGTFLFGLPAERPVALAFAAVLMILATILASIVPCLRAVHIDPGKTLKYE